jgi:transcriptional regulator with XRE-family HTH domain
MEAKMSELSDAIKEMRAKGMTYRQIARQIGGVSPSLIRKAEKGICDSPTLRAKLGLPPAQVAVEPCRECGDVHTHKTCTRQPAQPRYRLALEFDSAAQRNKMARRLQIYGSDRKEQSLRLLYSI